MCCRKLIQNAILPYSTGCPQEKETEIQGQNYRIWMTGLQIYLSQFYLLERFLLNDTNIGHVPLWMTE